MRERISKIIQTTGLSQKEFAISIGITPSAITEFIKGRSQKLSSDALRYIHQKFNIDINWLLTGEGSMFLEDTSIVVKEAPFCKTSDECLASVTAENIHQTRWFKELSPTRQHIVAAANTPEMSEAVCMAAKSLFTGFELGQEEKSSKLYKKGEAG